MDAIIRVSHVSKFFGVGEERVTALRDVNFAIEEGDIFGIMGMSGAGKSTLIRCLNYLEEPSMGEIIVNGRSLGSLSKKELLEERRKIGMIFQNFNLLEQKTVLQNISFPLEIYGMPKREARQEAENLMEQVGLKEKANTYPSKLSGGQKQRVAIARAIAGKPKVLLCDEATSALDSQNTQIILELLEEINRQRGITIVLITHQQEVVKTICNRMAVLELGKIAQTGSTRQILGLKTGKEAIS